jgi:hypothetical protein
VINEIGISELVGKTITAIERTEDEIKFVTSEGEIFKMYHDQDCCEFVYIESVTGDLENLIGTPILKAEESESSEFPPVDEHEWESDSYTWTFYKLATVKGWVDIRWYGTSNGYYSESVSFEKIKEAA